MIPSGSYAAQLRQELNLRSRTYSSGRAHVESYGSAPVIVFEPENGLHANFFDAAYNAIATNPDWMRRFDKVHAQAARSLPKPQLDPARRWRELDSSMSSDALLMNIFCTPGVTDSPAVRNALGVDAEAAPVFGWKARVPLANGRFDRTEVDMRFGSLLVEAKLTEVGFQTRNAAIVEAYRDFDAVFDRDRLPRVEIATSRWVRASEFPENNSQEFESVVADPALVSNLVSTVDTVFRPPGEPGYAAYQLIRNVLAAFAAECSFCVIHDERRPDLREQWFEIMAAIRSAALRVRMKVLTWQEMAALLPASLQGFLDVKYGIVAPGKTPSPIGEPAELAD
ncbi:MAG: PGN_0703 family putative restriction endonuclease [Terracidiphilus sp.]